MAKEKFEHRELTGTINVACKYENSPTRYWTGEKATICERIISIVDKYDQMGYVLSLRQLHYQMVTRNWIVNHDSAYKKLGNILDDLRYSGKIDWDSIEDRGRVPFIPYSVRDVKDALQDTIDQYRIDRQEGQKSVIELWTEKDALSGIFRRSTTKYHVRLVVNKGYTSSSAAYSAYERIGSAITSGKKFVILYFGDHDPSGLDMIRDIRDRLMFFLTAGTELESAWEFMEEVDEWFDKKDVYDQYLLNKGWITKKEIRKIENKSAGYDSILMRVKLRYYLEEKELFQVIPMGLTMEQINEYGLPPNPTKLTDSRSDKYIEKFGTECWEVDALEPNVLTSIVEENIESRIDLKQYASILNREKKEVNDLNKILKNHLKTKK